MKAVVYREYAPDDDYAKILKVEDIDEPKPKACLLYTSPSPRDRG